MSWPGLSPQYSLADSLFLISYGTRAREPSEPAVTQIQLRKNRPLLGRVTVSYTSYTKSNITNSHLLYIDKLRPKL